MAQAVRDMKQKFGDDVHGRLPDVCRVKSRKYNTAIAVLVGRHMDSVVVSSLQVAKDCMRFLTEKQYPPMEFIPLDNIQARLYSLGHAAREPAHM
jgi:structural maintenance of chromosome 1